MEDYGGFQTQFTSVMENVLRNAVGETTKLFERTLRQMKAELVQLRQENIDLKTAVFSPQYNAKDAENESAKTTPSFARCDIGVQCEKPIMVERCCSPAPFDNLLIRDIASDRLQDLCSSATEDRNRQLGLLLIKKEPQESDCDDYAPGYFLLKQEGAEPILVRKEPFKDTMERVRIPSTFQLVSSRRGDLRKMSTTNAASSENAASSSRKVDSSNEKVAQSVSTSTFTAGPASQSDTERQKTSTSFKKSDLPEVPANLPQPTLLSEKSAPMFPQSSKQGQMSAPRLQQTIAKVHPQINQTAMSQGTQSQHIQHVQHPPAVSHLGARVVQCHLQNPIIDPCPSVQPFQALTADKRILPASVDQNMTQLVLPFTQASHPSVSTPQSVIPAVPNVNSLGHCPAAQVHNPFPSDQHAVAPGQVPISLSNVPPAPIRVSVPACNPALPNHVSAQSVHVPVAATQVNPVHALGPIQVQSNEILPSHSQDLQNLQAHFGTVSHHSLPPSVQPPYSPNLIPFAPPSIPVQSIKTAVSQVSVQQTKGSSPLEHIPVTTSHYQIMSDSLCSSSDQFFPPPEDTSDLLQSLPPMPFHAPIVLTQQEAALEQPSMIQSQLSEQPLQLAPLLTLKELQAAASNQADVSKKKTSMPVEISLPTVNNFEEHIQRFPHCPGPPINSGCTDSIIGMQDDDPVEPNEDGSADTMSGMGEHYRVLSKPRSNFSMSDSTQEQTSFRMNMVKDLQIDNDVSKQKEGCDMAGQIWKLPESSCVLPHTAPSSNKGSTLQKTPRRVLEKKTECCECGRVLSNASSLENHMRLHRGERPYTCSQCGKAFPSVRGLNRHVKVHAEEKGYKCEECGRSFVYQFTLTKHKLIHSGDRPFPCKVCGKKFLAKADRATHMRMHTGEKPFFCSQCGKSFKHRVALNMHLQGHRGEKRYVCPHCEKGFVDLGNFKRHKRIHTGEKPFECKECGKRFTQSAHLKKHVNTQHVESKTK